MSGVSLVHFGYWTHPFATVTVDGPDGFEAEDIYLATYPRLNGTVTGEIAYVGHGDRAAIDAAGDVRGKIAVIAATGPDDPTYPSGAAAAGRHRAAGRAGREARAVELQPAVQRPQSDRPAAAGGDGVQLHRPARRWWRGSRTGR